MSQISTTARKDRQYNLIWNFMKHNHITIADICKFTAYYIKDVVLSQIDERINAKIVKDEYPTQGVSIPGFGRFFVSTTECYGDNPNYEPECYNPDESIYRVRVLHFRPYKWAKTKEFRAMTKIG